MSVLIAAVGPEQCTFTLGEQSLTLPFGPAQLARTELHADPPLPEELTNAIGVVIDHLDDLLRELPDVVGATEVHLCGPEMRGFADVEAGRVVEVPFLITQAAAEEVFRTLATERTAERRRNPGLRPELVPTIVAGCCVVVALIRRLQLEQVSVIDDARAPVNSTVETPSGGPR